MYANRDEWTVEDICYDQEHINKVLATIKNNFSRYFDNFLTCEAIPGIDEKDLHKLSDSLGIEIKVGKKSKDKARSYKDILDQGLADFEKDRKKYTDILDVDALEEYKVDPASFKATLRKDCPVIHAALFSHAKALDKFKSAFNMSGANDLLNVVTNLYEFAEYYMANEYDPDVYDNIQDFETLSLYEIDTESCTLLGVIGGGIKSHMLYKIYPSVFPNRNRLAIWALWYLTDKEAFDCKMDSEFLMIDTDKSVTQQNYFYPYELFTFYAHQIFQLLKVEAEKLDVYIDREFRYVLVDSFLSSVAKTHLTEIDFLTQQIKDSDYGHA